MPGHDFRGWVLIMSFRHLGERMKEEGNSRDETAVQDIEWLLTGRLKADTGNPGERDYVSAYGDLASINTCRLIADSVEKSVLRDIAGDYLDLLDTSSAVYEKKGGYALGIFASSWCRFLDHASRGLCGTDDNIEALASGKWLCHESCWTDASKVSIATGSPVDVECHGGIRIYAVPIWAGDEIAGSINFGYGQPPNEKNKLKEIADLYGVPVQELTRLCGSYQTRPPFIVDLAKRRLHTSARLIGTLIERKQTQDALKLSKDRYRALFSNGNDAVMVFPVTPEGRPGTLTEVNETACELLGYTRVEMLAMTPEELETDESVADIPRRMSELMRNKRILFELVAIAKDGRRIPLEVNSCLFDLCGQPSIMSVARDITERKRAEKRLLENQKKIEEANQQLKENQEQLVQSEKMASIGQLAAGVAHEINNPVAFIDSNLKILNDYREDLTELINSYVGLEEVASEIAALSGRQDLTDILNKTRDIRDRLDLPFVLDDFSKIIAESREGTERVKKIVQDLKDFSHVDQGELEWVDLTRCLDSTLNVAWNEIKYKAKVIKDYGEIPDVCCYPQQMNQVFMNVLVNAAQAIEEKGEIRIATRVLSGGDKVEVRISDTGKGMSTEDLPRVFDPFFTTKPIGKGTGLGLSVAHKIVKKHDGEIRVKSEPGKGTTFVIELLVQGPRAIAERGLQIAD
ncbi:MAG: ATP-binding protein [Pseudomonadota bacterium]